MKVRISGLIGFALFSASFVWSQYSFDLSCLSDTLQIVTPNGVADFKFCLTNTGSRSDIYELNARLIESVPGWFVTFCWRGRCVVPGVIVYDTLNPAQSDTTIHITVYTTQTPGQEILSLNVRSLGDPTQRDSIRVYTRVGQGIGEDRLALTVSRLPIKISPNPFSNETILHLPQATIELKVYDVFGKLVKTFPPNHYFIWDGSDQTGQSLPAGTYIVTFTLNKRVISSRVVLIK